MRNFILGTDWWTDCDDVVALRILARAHKAQEICLKGIVINACMQYSVPSLEGFLCSENVRNIPIGIDYDATDFGGNPPYQKRLSELCERYHTNKDVTNAVRLYREILAKSKGKIEFIEIGYLQAVAALLKSGPDDISDLSGMDLIKEKVSKMWVMAGKWNEKEGKENNFARNERSRNAANYFCDNCPVPVTFLGWEVGYDVITGDKLKKDDILYKAMCDHTSINGRSSWDPMLVLLALVGDEQEAGYSVVKGRASVNKENGVNCFTKSENGSHCYVVKKKGNSYYKNLINEKIKSLHTY